MLLRFLFNVAHRRLRGRGIIGFGDIKRIGVFARPGRVGKRRRSDRTCFDPAFAFSVIRALRIDLNIAERRLIVGALRAIDSAERTAAWFHSAAG